MKILETERLILREAEKKDGAFFLDLLNQPSFIKYIGDRNVRTLDQAREYIASRLIKSYRENGFGLWLVELKEDFARSEIPPPKSPIEIGICGFVKRDGLPDTDIGFAFLPQFERKGFAFEAAFAVLEYGKETLNLERVLAITSQGNQSSIKLLEKIGFKFESLIKLPHDPEELNLFSANLEAKSGK